MRSSRWLLPVLLILAALAGCHQQATADPNPPDSGPSSSDIDRALSEKISDTKPPLGAAAIGSYDITYGPVANGPASRIDAVWGGPPVQGWPYLLDVNVHWVDAFGAPVSDELYLDHSKEVVWFYQWPRGGDWHFQTS